jgi:hypothetical protein
MYEGQYPYKRYHRTLQFLQEVEPPPKSILDLGVENPFTGILRKEGYEVENTQGEDLDVDFSNVRSSDAEIVTAFEIFEHLVAPFNVLRQIKANRLVASIPLRLWFSSAYRNTKDPWDNHYHEFEDWQFDWLLEKAGWKIIKTDKWANPVKKVGIRPVLRYFTPRYYIVHAVK